MWDGGSRTDKRPSGPRGFQKAAFTFFQKNIPGRFILYLLLLILSGDSLLFRGMEARHPRDFFKKQVIQSRVLPEKSLFFLNPGKSSPALKFTARTSAGFMGVTHSGEILYRLRRDASPHGFPAAGITADPSCMEQFVGGCASRVLGRGRRPAASSSVRQSGDSGGTPLPGFSIVDLGDVYHGIQVKLRLRGQLLEKLFCVLPGGKPGRILIRVKGAGRLFMGRSGELKVRVEGIDLTFLRPQAFQIINGRYRTVEAAFRVRGWNYGFKLGPYDPDFPLIIEPAWIEGM